MNLIERTDYAGQYLADAFEIVGAHVIFISPEGWRMSSFLDDHHGTGVDVPVLRLGIFEVGICPEVIASSSQELEDDVFFDYLASLRVHAHLHIVNHALHPDLAELAVLSAQRDLNLHSFAVFEAVREDA